MITIARSPLSRRAHLAGSAALGANPQLSRSATAQTSSGGTSTIAALSPEGAPTAQSDPQLGPSQIRQAAITRA